MKITQSRNDASSVVKNYITDKTNEETDKTCEYVWNELEKFRKNDEIYQSLTDDDKQFFKTYIKTYVNAAVQIMANMPKQKAKTYWLD